MTTFSDDQWLYEEADITGLDRPGAELAAVELYGCTIRGAKLGEATLRRWVFEACTFTDCDLSNAVFAECTFQGCKFEGCRLIGVDWRAASPLTFDVTFHGCTMTYGVFTGLNLADLECIECDCAEVDFTEADLRRSRFAGTTLRGAIFSQTRLEQADLSRALEDFVDPLENRVAGAKFSMAATIRLAGRFGISVPPGT